MTSAVLLYIYETTNPIYRVFRFEAVVSTTVICGISDDHLSYTGTRLGRGISNLLLLDNCAELDL